MHCAEFIRERIELDEEGGGGVGGGVGGRGDVRVDKSGMAGFMRERIEPDDNGGAGVSGGVGGRGDLRADKSGMGGLTSGLKGLHTNPNTNVRRASPWRHNYIHLYLEDAPGCAYTCGGEIKVSLQWMASLMGEVKRGSRDRASVVRELKGLSEWVYCDVVVWSGGRAVCGVRCLLWCLLMG